MFKNRNLGRKKNWKKKVILFEFSFGTYCAKFLLEGFSYKFDAPYS